MDQDLKQRLIGAAVVTALAAIFIPMLFDDPIDDNGQVVSELTIPSTPVISAEDTANKLPASAAEVTGIPDNESLPVDLQNPDFNPSYQPLDDSDQAETLVEDTGPPPDEQQWIEESGGEEEPGPVADDADDNLPETQSGKPKPSETTETLKSPATTIQHPAPITTPPKAKITEVPQKSVNKPLPLKKAVSAKTKPGLVRWFIQAGSFSKKENALARWEALHKQGLPVLLETQATDKGPLYRLKVGPELDKKRATDIRDRLKKQNIKSIIVAE